MFQELSPDGGRRLSQYLVKNLAEGEPSLPNVVTYNFHTGVKDYLNNRFIDGTLW